MFIRDRCNPALHFILTTDAEEALRDADYIITTHRKYELLLAAQVKLPCPSRMPVSRKALSLIHI